ncbi:hypothetical protein PanWU01x14_169750 [Parasponia andersonii]|uniref:Uncharacterized protein n=1 Tax=Parasponia andersonii TaxID=3476 RepID=A0A2P5CAL9_PARAD|nr:hypothetical protein PanWU01x14_169750 [Parasponia andersonii]
MINGSWLLASGLSMDLGRWKLSILLGGELGFVSDSFLSYC